MKSCARCKQIKPAEFFYKDKRKPDGLGCSCKDCINKQRRSQKRWLLEDVKVGKRNWYKKQKQMAINYMGGKCQDCGFNTHSSALCFHHLSDKKSNPSRSLKNGFNSAKSELDKCVLLCHNCHFLRHHQEKIA